MESTMHHDTQAMIVRPREAAFLPEMPHISAEVMEKALTIGDLSKMPAEIRVRYYLAVCQSAGLNPLTRPFTPMKTQSGEVVLYANKDAAEQLRAKHRMSIKVLSREKLDDLYIITVEGTLPNGRSEETQGIVDTTGLKGQALANAMLKAETKAKRRVTLALCGLGFPVADEDASQPVRMNWQSGEMLDGPKPVKSVETVSLDEHIADLYGEPADYAAANPASAEVAAKTAVKSESNPEPEPPAAANGKQGGELYLQQILAVHRAHGKSALWVEEYETKVRKQNRPVSALKRLLDDVRQSYRDEIPAAPEEAPAVIDTTTGEILEAPVAASTDDEVF